MKKYLLLAAIALPLAACANDQSFKTPKTSAAAEPANAEAANQTIAAAETAAKRADKVGFEWRDTDGIIKKARQAVANNDYAMAVKLAKTAEQQGNLAYAQYESQQKTLAGR